MIIYGLGHRLSRWWYGGDSLQLPAWEDLQFETRHVCEQFITHHMEQCRQQVHTEARYVVRFLQLVLGDHSALKIPGLVRSTKKILGCAV